MPIEPWLRGPLDGVHSTIAPILRSFEMAGEDLEQAIGSLNEEELSASPGGAASVAFHVRHIVGSVDRLLTYAEGRQLSEAQLAASRNDDRRAGADPASLLVELQAGLASAAARVRAISPESLLEPREVGRKLLPTTVIGLLIHVAEHTQRHVGQAVTTARIVAATAGPSATESA